MKGFNVEIMIDPILKQYLVHHLKGDVVKAGNGAVIVDLIKPYLELSSQQQLELFPSNDKKKKTEFTESIKIEVPLLHCKTFSKKYNRIIYLDGIYHTVVSEYGQAIVRRHLKKMMRQAFHVFMDGYTSAYEELDKKRVKAGICAFFSEYTIDFTEKDVNSYARDWFRYRDKKYEGRISPILF